MRRKILIILCVVAVAFSVFSLPCSAQTFSLDYLHCSNGQVTNNYDIEKDFDFLPDFYYTSGSTSFTFIFQPYVAFNGNTNVQLSFDLWITDYSTSYNLNCFGSDSNSLLTSRGTFYGVTDKSLRLRHYTFYRSWQPPSSSSAKIQLSLNVPSGYSCICAITNFNLTYDDSSVVTNQITASTNDIKSYTKQQTEAQTNEEFGYEKSNTDNTDSGLDVGGGLIDSLTGSIDSFNNTVDNDVDGLLDSINSIKIFVHNLFDIFPAIVQYLFIFAIVFLVIRKVVGR